MLLGSRDRDVHKIFASVVIALFVLPSFSQRFSQESCDIPPNHLWIEPDADVVIGAVLPIHKSGEGVYGCGPISPDGVQVFEAMRWAVDVLNRRSGLISDESNSNESSLIPGVKLGLRVYDSCEHSALAVEHLTSLFPVLRSGPKSCEIMSKNSSLTIGVVDMSESSSQPEVTESLRDFFIPIIPLSLSTLVPPEKMSQVLLTVTKELKWSHITVLHEDEEYSISVAKRLAQSAGSGKITCITNIQALPRVSYNINSSPKELRPFRKAFKAATSGLEQGSAVIVVTRNNETAAGFLQVMAEFPEIVQQIQWMFSWIPPSSSLLQMNGIFSKNVRLYSIAPYPDRVVQFEDYWSALARTARFSNVNDRWFLEYFMYDHCGKDALS